LLLGVAERPNPREIAGRARDATASFLRLHQEPRATPSQYADPGTSGRTVDPVD
jgi:hypothetical protein